jgi:hypothetical protein
MLARSAGIIRIAVSGRVIWGDGGVQARRLDDKRIGGVRKGERVEGEVRPDKPTW